MTRRTVHRLAAAAAAVALSATAAAGAAASPRHDSNPLDWRYDGTSVSWNWQHAPHETAHFDVRYDNGHPAFYSTVVLNTPEHAEPDAPDVAGCGWQHWTVYLGTGTPEPWYPIPHPPAGAILAHGRVYVCADTER